MTMQSTSLIIGTTFTNSYSKHNIDGLINAYLTTKNHNISYECIPADPKREYMEVLIQEGVSGRPDWEIQGNKHLDSRIPQILLRICQSRQQSQMKMRLN